MQSLAEPLVQHRIVDTRIPDEAREEIGRIFCPHYLIPTDPRPTMFHARHHSAQQAGYSVNFVAYGSEVEIDPGELSGFFLLQWPTTGGATVRCGSTTANVAAGATASILSPTLPTRMTWHGTCEKIIILIRRDVMQAQFEALCGTALCPVEFATGVDMTSSAGRLLERHIATMLASAECSEASSRAYQILLRDGLTTLMLASLRHNHSALFDQAARAPAPGAVGRAEEFIEANLDQPMLMAQVAAAAGTNLRSLQDAFKRARGVSLTQSIHMKRLERFRSALSDPSGPQSVTEIAFSVGFGHLGRAAAAYRHRYGETPQQTLRRRH